MEIKNYSSEKPTLRILFLAAEPGNLAKLHLGKELQEVRNKLENNPYFEIKDLQAVKPDDISQAIMTYKPNIVHFSGHGQETGELCFEDELGNSKPISPEGLAELFELGTDFVKCVIVNACYSEKQVKILSQYVPVVIGTKKEISDKASIKFATGFYTALDPDLSQKSLDKAFRLGKLAIQFDGNHEEHSTPVLIFGSPEVRFSSEVETAFSTITKLGGIAVNTLIRGLSLTGYNMGLSDEIVKRIIDERIEKLKKYSDGIIEFEANLKEILREEYPLSEFSLSALLRLQLGLGISNEDINIIKNKILDPALIDNSYSWYDRGIYQDSLNNYEKAIECYTKAVEKKSNYSAAYYCRAMSNSKLSNYTAAIDDFTLAIDHNIDWEKSSTLSLAYFYRAFAFYQIIPNTDETNGNAIRDWTSSIDLYPNDHNSFFNRGLAYSSKKMYLEAIIDFEKSYYMVSDIETKQSRIIQIVDCYKQLGKKSEVDKWNKLSIDLKNEKTDSDLSEKSEYSVRE